MIGQDRLTACKACKQCRQRGLYLRQVDAHDIVCADLAQIGRFARVETWQFRILKSATPGPFTFLLPATRETPRRLQHPQRRTIGVRIPDHVVPRALLALLGEPIMSSTLLLPGEEMPLNDGREIRARLEHQIDAVLDSGSCGLQPTTVIDLSVSPPVVLRQGLGRLPGMDAGRG